jgi:uroporphyrinogen-III decarboxylase
MMEKNYFDPNAYCSGHINGQGDNPHIAAFPEGFSVEAQALGARIVKTANGFPSPEYLFSDPGELRTLPLIHEQPPVKKVLEQIETAPREKTRLLKVNGPYSILASLVEPKLFYRWLAKNPSDIHAALAQITAGSTAYIRMAFRKGVRIISLADPFANPEILGERRYREFAAAYLLKLLGEILKPLPPNAETSGSQVSPRNRLIHLCPHNSVTLEQFGLLKSEAIPLDGKAGGSYTALLLSFDAGEDAVLLGNQCIYAADAKSLIRLTLLTALS